MRRQPGLFALLAVATHAMAAAPPTTLAARVKATYDFRPRKATEDVRARKVKEMDALWDVVKNAPDVYLPQLRELLRDPKADPFFLFDGSQLLLSLSSSPGDLQLAADAVAKTNLGDVDPSNYFESVHRLTRDGAKTLPAIERMLDVPEFKAFVPEHSLTLGKDWSVTYCTLLLDERVYVDRFAARLGTEKDVETAKALVTALAYSLSPSAHAALVAFATKATDPAVKDLAIRLSNIEQQGALPEKKLVSKRADLDTFLKLYVGRDSADAGFDVEMYAQEAPYLVMKADAVKLTKLRHACAERVSDEALVEIDYLTRLIRYALTASR